MMFADMRESATELVPQQSVRKVEYESNVVNIPAAKYFSAGMIHGAKIRLVFVSGVIPYMQQTFLS